MRTTSVGGALVLTLLTGAMAWASDPAKPAHKAQPTDAHAAKSSPAAKGTNAAEPAAHAAAEPSSHGVAGASGTSAKAASSRAASSAKFESLAAAKAAVRRAEENYRQVPTGPAATREPKGAAHAESAAGGHGGSAVPRASSGPVRRAAATSYQPQGVALRWNTTEPQGHRLVWATEPPTRRTVRLTWEGGQRP